jgi:hypothetical protein
MKRHIAWLSALFLVASAASAQVDVVGNAPSATSANKPMAGERAKDFGTSFFYTSIDAYAMTPYNSGFINNRAAGSSTGHLSCSAASTNSLAVGQIQLPSGVDIAAVAIWGTDNAVGANVRADLVSSCLPDFDEGFPTLTTLATATSTGTPGAFRALATGLPGGVNLVDNQSCTYRVEVQLGPNDATCDINLFFSKLRVQWARVIPPAPVTATFDDVPVGSQFFAEVEAFVDTGITSGCDASNFCPGNFVTRLQMAAFFARALGLQPANLPDPANP